MLTAVDHLVIGVADVAHAVAVYRDLGFTVTQRADEDDARPQAAYVEFGDFFLEFRGTDAAAAVTPSPAAGSESDGGEGLRRIVFQCDDIDDEAARLRSHGLHVTEPVTEPVDRPGGPRPLRTVVVESIIPAAVVERPRSSDGESSPAVDPRIHPNTVTVVERIYFAVAAIDRELGEYEQLLGMAAPEPEMGTVIMSLMSVFYLGDIGIAVAEPRGQGPTAQALDVNGPGLFQVLFRAEHLDRAAAVMIGNGVREPTRGTRLSGESALLVEPEQACGLFIALAGQP